jgi:UDPglucose 6-dehydrogenase
VDLINQRRRQRIVQLAAELLDRPFGPAGPDLSGVRVAVLGATFKPSSDDVRDSPALSVVRKLSRCGADVFVYDPEGMDNARREVADVGYAKSVAEAVTGADLVCVLTEWEEFRSADPSVLGQLAAGRRVIDGRNCLDAAAWRRAGWAYRGMGRPA